MEVTGKIILKLPMQSGVSKAGNNWSKQEYVLETQEAYPKKIFFSFFGDRANQYPLEQNDVVKVSFDIDSHEYNGRWFTSINAWKAEKLDASQMPQAVAPQATMAAQQPTMVGVPGTVPPPPADFMSNGISDDNDNLPF